MSITAVETAGTSAPSTRAAGAGPVLRRMPPPVSEPPVTDTVVPPRHRRTVDVGHVQGTLALVVGTRPCDTPDAVFGPQPTGTSDLPDPQQWTRSLAQAVVEVLGGIRPATQLVRWTTAEVFAALQRRALIAARTAPARSARPAVVRSVRVCEPVDGVAEASAVVVDQGRVRAVALRLEGMDGRWRATAVEIG